MNKNILILFVVALLFTKCTTTVYKGSLVQPQSAMFSNANFKYVKTIYGNARAVYGSSGFDKVRVANGLISSAKAKMYETHTFMPNQIITNISNDIIETNRPTRYEVKVVLSADVYEFSNDGTYSSEDNKNDISPSNIEKEAPIKANEEKSTFNDTNTIQSVNPSNEENPNYIIFSGRKYAVGDEVIYTFGNKAAAIESFKRNKGSGYFYDVEIKFLHNDKVKTTSLEFIR